MASFGHLVINLDDIIDGVFPSGPSRWPSTHIARYANTIYLSPTRTILNTVLCLTPRSAFLHKVIHLAIPCLDLLILRTLLQSTLLPALQIMELVHTHATILETVSTQVAPLDSLSETYVNPEFSPWNHTTKSDKLNRPYMVTGLSFHQLLQLLWLTRLRSRCWTARVHWSMLCEDPRYTRDYWKIIQEEKGAPSRHCIDYIYTQEHGHVICYCEFICTRLCDARFIHYELLLFHYREEGQGSKYNGCNNQRKG